MLISHAQNMEDVILWRVLRHVTPGFYIDIGAHDPVVDSVSLLFHAQGWRGIHVEPVAPFADKLRLARPGDQVLQVAIGCGRSSMAFHEVGGTGLSTGRAEIAEEHRDAGHSIYRFETPCLPLSEVLAFSRGRDVHWLKIDVEGMEADVIRSWEPAAVRPWVVVVEAIDPCGRGPAFVQWEPVLRALGYEFIYFDGVNRFYVSDLHPELKAAFGPGPNIMDNFTLGGRATSPFCSKMLQDLAATQQQLADSLAAAQRAQEALAATRTIVEQSEQARDALTTELKMAEAKIGELNELSHRLWLAAAAYKRELELHMSAGLLQLSRRAVARLLEALLTGVRKRPRLKRRLASALGYAPLVKRRLLAFSAARPVGRSPQASAPTRSWPRRTVTRMLEMLLASVRRHPALKQRLRRTLDLVPGLKRRLIAFGAARPQDRTRPLGLRSRHAPAPDVPASRRAPPCDASGVSASGRRIYGQMRALRAVAAAGNAGYEQS
jgi:FkbM family methyltransferase